MKNYVLTSEYDFASGHYLKGHTGKCRNLHGHNYLVRLEVGADELQTEGSSRSMVIDFYDIKQEFRALLDSLAANPECGDLFKSNMMVDSYKTGIAPLDYYLGYQLNVYDDNNTVVDSYPALGFNGGCYIMDI